MSAALLCKGAYHDVPWTLDTMTVVYSNKLNMSENVLNGHVTNCS